MQFRGYTVLFLFAFVSACGGGSGSGSNNNEQIIEDVVSPDTNLGVERELLSTYIPSDQSRLIGFDSINDDRIIRILTSDNLIATLYGTKNNDGYINEINKTTIEDGDGKYILIDTDTLSGAISMQSLDTTYSINQDDNGDVIYRIEVDDQFVEYVISNSTETNFIDEKTDRFAEIRSKDIVRMRIESDPNSEITVDGCASEIQNTTVRAYRGNGQFINQYVVFPGDSGNLEVAVHGISRVDAKTAEFADDVIRFLREYEILNVSIGAAVDRVEDSAALLLQRRISENTNLIENLIHDASFFESIPVTAIDSSVAKLRRISLQGLKTIFKYSDIPSQIHKSILAGEILASSIDLASAVQFDQVTFEVVVTTKSGEIIKSTPTDAVSADGPYPDLSIEIPCRNVYRGVGGRVNSSFSVDRFIEGAVPCTTTVSPLNFTNIVFEVKVFDGRELGHLTFLVDRDYISSDCGFIFDGVPNELKFVLEKVAGVFFVNFESPVGDSWVWNVLVSDDAQSATARFQNSYFLSSSNEIQNGSATGEFILSN